MDFYYGIMSGNSARAAFGLLEAAASFVPHRLDVPTGDSRAAGYLALNPLGKVPALVDGTVQLWESNAINWYVAETNPAARLLPPSPAGRASVQRWLFFQAAHVSPACFAVFRFTNQRVQDFWRLKGDAPSAEAGRKELARFLPVLDQVLAGSEWLEPQFSLADIAYAPHLWLIREGGFDFSASPHVGAWLDRVLARPAWKKAEQLVFGP